MLVVLYVNNRNMTVCFVLLTRFVFRVSGQLCRTGSVKCKLLECGNAIRCFCRKNCMYCSSLFFTLKKSQHYLRRCFRIVWVKLSEKHYPLFPSYSICQAACHTLYFSPNIVFLIQLQSVVRDLKLYHRFIHKMCVKYVICNKIDRITSKMHLHIWAVLNAVYVVG